MAAGTSRKISAASARAHTRKPKRSPSSALTSGIFKKILLVSFVGISAWVFQAIRPPPPKLCGSPGGPPVTTPRVKLRDGRHLAYQERGVPKDKAKHKIIYVHGFYSSRLDVVFSTLSPEIMEELGVYIVSFDKPGYGESDPDPKRTPKSIALDIEELADQLGLGSKFYVLGKSMGGQVVWTCLKYIPHRLAGATLIAPVVNYWWKNLPLNISSEAYYQQLPRDQWALRVAHYTSWLTYWWNTQNLFPKSSAITRNPDVFSRQDKEIMATLSVQRTHEVDVKPQGDHESLHRNLIVGFGIWEFDPMDLENPFPNNQGAVQLWQGDDDLLVPVTLQRYIAHRLPWIRYHELPSAGHFFPLAEGMFGRIIKMLVAPE